ncbi:MAG: hypothetical protein J3K34DRAFT_401820 [Monoraphidium minutum]|nr:MAG: hypothetical protein J3K34DRAFT_401820 [Monoraphidium minutum]
MEAAASEHPSSLPHSHPPIALHPAIPSSAVCQRARRRPSKAAITHTSLRTRAHSPPASQASRALACSFVYWLAFRRSGGPALDPPRLQRRCAPRPCRPQTGTVWPRLTAGRNLSGHCRSWCRHLCLHGADLGRGPASPLAFCHSARAHSAPLVSRAQRPPVTAPAWLCSRDSFAIAFVLCSGALPPLQPCQLPTLPAYYVSDAG